MMCSILILGSGTQALAILKDLKEAGYNILMLTSEHGNYSDCSRYVDKVFYTDYLPSSKDFLNLICSICDEYSVSTIFPMGDSLAEIISINKKLLSTITSVRIPDYSDFQRGYDKNSLMALCREKNYPHPYTKDLSLSNYLDRKEFESFPFPGIIKPNCTTGGRGMVIVDDYDTFCSVYPDIRKQYGACHLQRYIKPGGRQVKVQLYVSRDGEIHYSSVLNKVRWFPVEGGSSCCAVTMSRDIDAVSICSSVLNDLNWEGFADFDLIEDRESGDLLIMEINPRLPACIGASVHAGMKWGSIMAADAMNKPLPEVKYKTGVSLRHLGFDFLWFLSSSSRFHTRPSWFRFIGRDVFYQDFMFLDQRPFWIGTLHNIKKILNPEFRKSKSNKAY